jgi:hypothetical protein
VISNLNILVLHPFALKEKSNNKKIHIKKFSFFPAGISARPLVDPPSRDLAIVM